jgi:hypothetical protein
MCRCVGRWGLCVCEGVSQITTTKYAKISGQSCNILLQICTHGEPNIPY